MADNADDLSGQHQDQAENNHRRCLAYVAYTTNLVAFWSAPINLMLAITSGQRILVVAFALHIFCHVFVACISKLIHKWLFGSKLGFSRILNSLDGAFWRFRLPASIIPQWSQIAVNSLPNDLSMGCLSIFTVGINSKSSFWTVLFYR